MTMTMPGCWGAKRRYDFLVTLLVAYASGDDDTVKEILGRQLEIAILSRGYGPSGDSPATHPMGFATLR